MLYYRDIETPLGSLFAIGDAESLYVLEYPESKRKARLITSLEKATSQEAAPGTSPAIDSIEGELEHYIKGDLRVFTTRLVPHGTPFQQRVWQALCAIPYGETRTYRDVAEAIGMPRAYRAVARANATNPISIAIPCHRVVPASGGVGGYGGGCERKARLIDIEKAI